MNDGVMCVEFVKPLRERKVPAPWNMKGRAESPPLVPAPIRRTACLRPARPPGLAIPRGVLEELEVAA
jgi:hypothetical protein